MVIDRLTQLSLSKDQFDSAATMYNKALRVRSKIFWFNPPYSQNVETNIGHELENLITKHFLKRHRFHRICNRSNIKISYSRMPNMSAVISSHKKKLLSTLPKTDRPPTAHPKCNCRIKTPCPLNGVCKQKSIVYNAEISFNNTVPAKNIFTLTKYLCN